MKKLIIYLALLCILNSVMFYGNSLGINVILYMIAFIPFLVYALKTNNKLINKKGLLFIIPIMLLSLTYFVYDNSFRLLNIVAIPILYVLMFIYTVKPTYNIKEVIADFVNLIFGPLDEIPNFFNVIKKSYSTINLSKNNKNKLKSILIVIPITIIVLALLISSDGIFEEAFSGIIDAFKNISIFDLILRIIITGILFIYTGATLYNILFKYKKDEIDADLKIDSYTFKLLFTVLNIIYLVFDIIQIRSLLLHRVSAGFDYAQYARSGFFQLMAISLINMAIILFSKKSEENKYNKIMGIIMVLLTLVIIVSSFYRMYMYENAFGYTVLRLLVYVALITEGVCLVPTIGYIINNKVNILKYYIIIIVAIYTGINMVSVDYIIAKNNINRYYEVVKIDLDYLRNEHADNIPLLIELKNVTNDEKLKGDIKWYLDNIDLDTNTFEYNLSKANAKGELKTFSKSQTRK